MLVELTCCAEEGVAAARVRKEVRYHALVDNINSNSWRAELFTIEVGARGLIATGTFNAFIKLGFPRQDATNLCKTLSVVVARCSYAIYSQQQDLVAQHRSGDCNVTFPFPSRSPFPP